ncbi:MAG: sigma 54 modulation/S30EA ribosomal C-terminal domain-containing protein [Actinomycetota bacterium]
MKRRQSSNPFAVELEAEDGFPENVQDRARTKIDELTRYTPEPILHARVRLSRSHNPAVERPVIAQANLDVNGRLLRAQVSAPTGYEAVDELDQRLRRQLRRMARHWEAKRGARPKPEPNEWRHISAPTERPPHYPLPEHERRVVRHKTFGPGLATPDEAVFDLDMLDYEFYLFTEEETGQDSVIYRGGPTGYRMAQVDPEPDRTWSTAVPLTVSEQPAPILTVAEAQTRLDATGLPFLFFAEPETGRGRVLYRRYDGHYGLIRPTE